MKGKSTKKHSHYLKRIMAIMMGVIMTLALCACGSNNANTDSGDKDAQGNDSSDQTGDGSEENYNVVLEWLSLGNTPTEENIQKIESAINEITVPEIGVTVTLYPVDLANLESDTTLAVSSGEKVDLVCSVGTGVGNLVNSGLIVPLDDLYAEYGSDMGTVLGDAILGGSYNGQLYGVPNAYIQGESYGFSARTDLLEKYNIEIDPAKLYTMDELSDIFKTVKEGEGDGFYCVAGINSTSDWFTEYLGTVDKLGATTAAGGLLLNDNWDNTTVENIYASDQYAEFAQTMYDWSQNGYIPSDAASNTDDGTVQIKAGNFLGRVYYTSGSSETDFKAQTGYDCTLIQMKAPYKTTDRFQNILWSIPTTSTNQEKAFEFLNLLYADNDIDTILQYGLEGETYKVIEEYENGNKLINFVDGVDASTAPYYCYAGVYGDRLSWPVMEPNSITFNEDLREYNNTITDVSPALGYCFVIGDDISSKYSAVSSVIAQYKAVITAGSVNPKESLASFNKALEDAGINDVISENQRQLDEWLAKK